MCIHLENRCSYEIVGKQGANKSARRLTSQNFTAIRVMLCLRIRDFPTGSALVGRASKVYPLMSDAWETCWNSCASLDLAGPKKWRDQRCKQQRESRSSRRFLTDSISSLSWRMTSSSCFLRLMELEAIEVGALLAWLGTWLRPLSALSSKSWNILTSDDGAW